MARVELLHVDPRVVATLDGGQDDAGARRVEQRDRRRLVAARVLVGVVADDGEPRHGRVDPSLEASERCRDFVERAVEPVDPPLERDGEIDEIAAAAPLQGELRGPDPAQPHVQHKSSQETDHSERHQPRSRSSLQPTHSTAIRPREC